MNKHCWNCRHYDPYEDDDTGECLRYPPHPHYLPDEPYEDMADFPIVHEEWRCGEWAPIDKEDVNDGRN